MYIINIYNIIISINRCVSDISNIEFKLISNIFSKNVAINGGALYLSNALNDELNENRTINISNNIFQKNKALNFGGAIYYKFNKVYSVVTNNNDIVYNEAGIMGGGIYTPEIIDKKLFDIGNCNIKNNTVNSYENNYTSKPAYIKLNTTLNNNIYNINSGDYFPLTFTLHDEFDNIINDNTMYYSLMSLMITLKEENNKIFDEEEDSSNLNKNYYLTGNTGTFVNGKCDLNNLKIYANPNTYILNGKIYNYNEELEIRINKIKIKINECGDEKVTLKNKNNITYCEDPKCHSSCPVDSTATCKLTNKTVNDINKNICECISGYYGNNCSKIIYIEFSKINTIVLIINIPMFIILSLFSIFLTIYRKTSIIDDIGFLKILFFSFGIILYFISNLFITYEHFFSCSLNFLFKHTGISIVLIIYYIIMTLNSVLGNGNHNNDKFKFDTKDTNTCYDEDKVIIKSVITDTYSYNQPFIPLRISLVQNLKNEKSANMASLYDGVNENIKKKLRKVNSLFIEVSFIYVLLITFMIIVVIVESYNNSKAKVYKIVKNRNGFVFKCKLEDYDLYLCIIEFFIFLIILVKGKNIINYECIFHCTKYITISAMIGIVFGPLMTVSY
eukprot:jgi/Orpsp1_1/1178047/evm.model.c7180000063848.1